MEKNKEIDRGLESPIEKEGITFSLDAKLFALNAAFEAARAGDAGAEFARLVHEWQATSMVANKTWKETKNYGMSLALFENTKKAVPPRRHKGRRREGM